ncbi:hypothetical protein [Bradyrhizobium manausense]|uniref:hypothetical protein n=1 Tax=Bradyrhizobium manausense TaxID=989370 RepID=UPI001FDA9038|nr:hypothetical protein [Bradyrhizobium manausense]
MTIYQSDSTQGPACAIAAGAATIYRNYFAKVAGRLGQTKDRQIDALADLGESRECLLSRSAVRRVTAADELLSACGINLVIKEQGLVRPYRVSNPNSPWRTHSYFGDGALSSARGLREGGFPGTSKSILSWARIPEDRVSESLDHELA